MKCTEEISVRCMESTKGKMGSLGDSVRKLIACDSAPISNSFITCLSYNCLFPLKGLGPVYPSDVFGEVERGNWFTFSHAMQTSSLSEAS